MDYLIEIIHVDKVIDMNNDDILSITCADDKIFSVRNTNVNLTREVVARNLSCDDRVIKEDGEYVILYAGIKVKRS